MQNKIKPGMLCRFKEEHKGLVIPFSLEKKPVYLEPDAILMFVEAGKKKFQLNKYVRVYASAFLDPSGKKIFIYTDEPFEELLEIWLDEIGP